MLSHYSLALVACVLVVGMVCTTDAKSYEHKEAVSFYVNKVGPFANPSETYRYYSFPFCRTPQLKEKWEDLGEVLEGDRMMKAPYSVWFMEDIQDVKEVCAVTLAKKHIKKFRDAIDDDYYVQFLVDDLPVWAFVGERELLKDPEGKETGKRYWLFTHLDFSLSFNNKHVIEVVVMADPNYRTDVSDPNAAPIEVRFTYSVHWASTSTPYSKRMEKYQDTQHFEIHWLSIINSFVLVILLTGFLAAILLRVLRNDFQRYTKAGPDEEEMEEEETGWKLIHGDVFRFPVHPSVFTAVLGNGIQLFTIIFCLLGMAVIGFFYPYNRGVFYTASVSLYALTAGIAGYVAGAWYKKLGGVHWAWNVLLTLALYAGPFLLLGAFLNTVAVFYHATQALPFGTIMLITSTWLLVTFPLTVLGAIAGKNIAAPFEAPVRTKPHPREVPLAPWYRKGSAQIFMAGFLPFSAIYIELHYIFAAVWGHRVYTLYAILFLAFIMLLIVTGFITIALTYFQLAVEDHRWWWRSFFCGGSTGLFIYAYSFFFYFERSDMFGFMQVTRFFAVMFLVSYAFFLMLGTVGFFSSLFFVRAIYRALKLD